MARIQQILKIVKIQAGSPENSQANDRIKQKLNKT